MLSCRFCSQTLERSFVDLGLMPLANAYLGSEDEIKRERRYPLHARVCTACMLVQVEDVVPPEVLFSNYAYFSSYSSSWLEHAKQYAESTICRLRLGPDSLVVEIASNDGYLLKNFLDGGIPVLGIEPAENVAAAARTLGIPTEVEFFSLSTAQSLRGRGIQADLVVANNVFAHIQNLNDFAAGLAILLKHDGVLSIEVPHLLRLIEDVQFDTIYHEHCSYFSLTTAEKVLKSHGLQVFDVEQLPTHGGSIRLWATTKTNAPLSESVRRLRDLETDAGMADVDKYSEFAPRVEACRTSLLEFLANSSANKEAVVAYGAAAKGNTLLNFCGITPAQVEYVVDRSPYKQGKLLPGSHLRIEDPSKVAETKPDYLLTLAWNLRQEIRNQMSTLSDWGGRFVFPVPLVEIVE